MDRSWNPMGFAQQLVQLLEKRWPGASKVFWAEQCGVSPAFMTGIIKMLKDESDDAWKKHRQPQKDTIDLMADHLELSDAEHNQLLLLAGHLLVPQTYLESSPALRKLALLMQDTTLHADTRASLEADLNALAEGWKAYDESRITLYQRRWDKVIAMARASMDRMTIQMYHLPAHLLDIEAIARLHRGEINKAEQLLKDPIITSLADGQFPQLQASILLHLGDVQREKAQWDEAKASYDAACAILEKETGADKDTKVQIRAERKRATIDLFKGDWRYALSKLQNCLNKFEALGDRYELARTHQNLGWAYDLQGDWEQSFHHRSMALHLAREHRINQQVDTYLVMMSSIHLASDYRQRRKLEEAELAIDDALKLAELLGERRYQWFASLERAQIYHLKWRQALRSGQTEQAKEYIKKAEQWAVESCERYPEQSSYYRALSLTVHGKLLLEQLSRRPIISSSASLPPLEPSAQDTKTYKEFFDAAKAKLEEAHAIFFQLQCFYHEARVNVLLCELYLETDKGETGDAGEQIDERRSEVKRRHDHFRYPQHLSQVLMIASIQAIRQKQISTAVDLCADAWYHANDYNIYALAELEGKFYWAVQQMLNCKPLSQEETDYLAGALDYSPSDGVAFAQGFCLRVANALEHKVRLSRSTAIRKRNGIFHVVQKVIRATAEGIRRDRCLQVRLVINPESLLAEHRQL